MNIVSVRASQHQQDCLLREGDRIVLKVRYKGDLHIARVETENERRVFTITEEGLLRSRPILKNEYGVPIGSLNYDNFSLMHGTVDIENVKYRFDIIQAETTELHIYKGSRRNLIYNCQLLFEQNNKKGIKVAFASLIISVAWYLFLKDVSKAHPTFNEPIIL